MWMRRYNIKMDLREIGTQGVEQIQLAQNSRTMVGYCEQKDEPSSPISLGFQLKNSQVVKKNRYNVRITIPEFGCDVTHGSLLFENANPTSCCRFIYYVYC